MRITEKDGYKILADEKDNLVEFALFLETVHENFKQDNVVIDILKYEDVSLDELLKFLKISNKHRREKKSFVIANDSILIDHVPEELVVVPTLEEAGDIIEMEEIERDLGF